MAFLELLDPPWRERLVPARAASGVALAAATAAQAAAETEGKKLNGSRRRPNGKNGQKQGSDRRDAQRVQLNRATRPDSPVGTI